MLNIGGKQGEIVSRGEGNTSQVAGINVKKMQCGGEKGDEIFTMRMEGVYKKPLAIQIREGVKLR